MLKIASSLSGLKDDINPMLKILKPTTLINTYYINKCF
jgi:hypothetical protein